MTVATLLLTCLIFLLLGWTERNYFVTALSVGGIVAIASSNGGTTSQDLKSGFLVGATPRSQQIAILIGALGSALILGPILLRLNEASTVYVPVTQLQQKAPPAVKIDPATFKRERISGPQSSSDRNEYFVYHHTDERIGHAGKYLLNDQGAPVYLVDPGINGIHRTRPDGSPVTKFDAPKATLMSYIIKGILNRELPWGLVLLGVMIAVVLEMAGVPSLAFAVGVYLPLSASSPIFIGGLIRWLVDRTIARKHQGRQLTPEQLAAEGDKSAGVLMASGYIAGGAIAGIIIAIVLGLADPLGGGFRQGLAKFTTGINEWSKSNPFFEGSFSDFLALIPFAVLIVILYLTGREKAPKAV